MDPCPFVRIVVGNLAVKLPVASKPAFSAVHPSSSPCFCKIKLKNYPSQIASVPLTSQQHEDDQAPPLPATACFNLTKSQFNKLVSKSSSLKIEIYTGRRGNTCGLSSGKLLGSVSVPLEGKAVESRAVVIKSGWVSIGGGANGSSSTQLHLNVKAEPDRRFVFRFDGEPECSPQVFQVNGNVRQPVFTCKFSFRNSGEHNLRSRSSMVEPCTSKSWFKLPLRSARKEQNVKDRKGWSITIHDLSGSPVALASMVTPFVPSPGSDRVSRSNPGAWLILRPGDGTWKPWGRLEAWREPGCTNHHLGYRFELLPDVVTGVVDAVTLSDSALGAKNGGRFTIDISTGVTPASTPGSSCDLGSGSESGSGSWAQFLYRGFVMSSTVEGDGRCSMPEVEVGVQHVTCTEDAAAFVALAAAVDLSREACRPFSRKLRKELRQPSEELVV